MIVGVTGTAMPFARLVSALGCYAAAHPDEVVWVQHGDAALPPGLNGEPVVSRTRLMQLMKEADVVVSHAGCGTMLDALSLGHFPVVVARRRALGEHVNDHQLELLDALEQADRIVAVRDISALPDAIARAQSQPKQVRAPENAERLKQAVREAIVERGRGGSSAVL